MQKHIIFMFSLLLQSDIACSADTINFNETRFQQLIQAEKTEGLKTQQAIDTEIEKNREWAVVFITNSFVERNGAMGACKGIVRFNPLKKVCDYVF